MLTSAAHEPASRLEASLRAGRFVFTAEIAPPISCAADDLLAKALPLRGLADAVNVTDGASARTHMSALAAAAILARNGIEPVLQVTCRDRNRIALAADLMGAAACGVHNLLLLTGDDPSAGDEPQAKPVFDLDSRRLTELARRIRDRGELPSGRKIAGAAPFFLGTADLPMDPPPGWRPEKLAAKVASGAQFAQTQFCMDAGLIRRYTRRLAECEAVNDLALLIGIAPLRSAKSARWMRHHLPGTIIPDALVDRLDAANDPAAEGRRICLDLIEELARIEGVAGVHLMAPANEADVPPVIAEARKRLPPDRQSVLASFVPDVDAQDLSFVNETIAASRSEKRFTAKQGQYLAFIYLYTRLHRRPPAEADMQEYFRVSPPSVHQMLVTLERAGLIRRQPSTPRSIELRIDPARLPELL
jgi:methylenetetrahydrofolate reductase (NADH)